MKESLHSVTAPIHQVPAAAGNAPEVLLCLTGHDVLYHMAPVLCHQCTALQSGLPMSTADLFPCTGHTDSICTIQRCVHQSFGRLNDTLISSKQYASKSLMPVRDVVQN